MSKNITKDNDVIFEVEETPDVLSELKYKFSASVSRKFLRHKKRVFSEIPERRQMVVFADDFVSNKVLANGVYERQQLDMIMSWLKEKKNVFNNTVLDIGANIGNHSLFFSGFFSKCISFEPNPRTFSVLKINAELADNVYVNNVGLSDEKTTAVIYTNYDNVGASSLSGEWNKAVDSSFDVQLEILDDFLDKDEKIGLMKIDVEGHEMSVLKGSAKTIKDNKPVIMFEHNNEDGVLSSDKDVIALLKDYGYQEFYEVIDGWDGLKDYLAAYPRPLRSIAKLILLATGRKIHHRIVRINEFVNKQYPVVIACVD